MYECGRCIHVADIAAALDFRVYTLLHLGGKGSKPPESAGDVVYVCAAVGQFFFFFFKYCSVQNAAWSS